MNIVGMSLGEYIPTLLFNLVIDALIVYGIYRYIKNRKKRKQHEKGKLVVNNKWCLSWGQDTIVAGISGKRDEIFQEIENRLNELEVPNVKIEKKDVVYFGTDCQKLVIENTNFRGFYFLIGAYDYGKQLYVSQELMINTKETIYYDNHYQPSKFSMQEKRDFDSFDLSVKRAVEGALKNCLQGKLESATVNQKTAGFVNVS